MLNESEQSKVKLEKELGEYEKQVKKLTAEANQQRKNNLLVKEKAAKDESVNSELRKELFELKQTISQLMSEREQLKSDVGREMRRFVFASAGNVFVLFLCRD